MHLLSFILDSNGYGIKCKTPSLTRIVIGIHSLRIDYLFNSISATAGGTGATGTATTTSCVPVTFGAKLVCSGKVYQRCFIISYLLLRECGMNTCPRYAHPTAEVARSNVDGQAVSCIMKRRITLK